MHTGALRAKDASGGTRNLYIWIYNEGVICQQTPYYPKEVLWLKLEFDLLIPGTVAMVHKTLVCPKPYLYAATEP